MKALLDELLALDLLTLRDPVSGGALEPDAQRLRLQQTLTCCCCLAVRRAGALVAYATLEPQAEGQAFVRGFSLHPASRNAAVLGELLSQVAAWMGAHGVQTLHSHVLKGNAASLALHRKLGFAVQQENERALAFSADRAALLAHPAVRRAALRAAELGA